MADTIQKWTPVRTRHSISFYPWKSDDVAHAKKIGIIVEASRKKFDDYDKCMAECEDLTEKGNCARWEFAYWTKEYTKKLREIAEDERFFKPELADETKTTIYSVVDMMESMAREMVQ